MDAKLFAILLDDFLLGIKQRYNDSEHWDKTRSTIENEIVLRAKRINAENRKIKNEIR